MKFLVIPLFSCFCFSAVAGDYTYDPQTGNSYYTSPSYNGGARVQGYNYNNGSSWNTEIKSNGDMSGMDSKGNMWNYNDSTGTYMNYGTGQMCVGKGAGRVCN